MTTTFQEFTLFTTKSNRVFIQHFEGEFMEEVTHLSDEMIKDKLTEYNCR